MGCDVILTKHCQQSFSIGVSVNNMKRQWLLETLLQPFMVLNICYDSLVSPSSNAKNWWFMLKYMLLLDSSRFYCCIYLFSFISKISKNVASCSCVVLSYMFRFFWSWNIFRVIMIPLLLHKRSFIYSNSWWVWTKLEHLVLTTLSLISWW